MIQGLIGKKMGMTHLFGAQSRVIPVTVLEVGPCVVTQVRTEANDGYDAVQIGYGVARQLSNPARGHLRAAGAQSRHLREFEAGDVSEYTVGQSLPVTLFQPGDIVDVTSTSKGRGFAGAMKRHGFHGGKRTHGQSDRARATGSIGAGTFPGRVYKGKKMPGHMGNRRVTVRNLVVERVDPQRNLLMVRGAVPGSRNTYVMVRYTKGAVIADRLSPEEWAALIGEPVAETPAEEPAEAELEEAEADENASAVEETTAEETPDESAGEEASVAEEEPAADEPAEAAAPEESEETETPEIAAEAEEPAASNDADEEQKA
jgi:large subunit ribosomal protein L3